MCCQRAATYGNGFISSSFFLVLFSLFGYAFPPWSLSAEPALIPGLAALFLMGQPE
jgi:hypothetical protein